MRRGPSDMARRIMTVQSVIIGSLLIWGETTPDWQTVWFSLLAAVIAFWAGYGVRYLED